MDSVEIISEMRKLHLDVEAQFLSFNKIVPYNHNPTEVYSPRLYSILQSACAQVTSMMGTVTKSLNISLTDISKASDEKQKKFEDYFMLLNEQGMLAGQSVAPREKIDMTISPFRFRKQNVPKWWQDYNDTKHDLPKGAYIGTIRNVLNALAAVTILHHIAECALNSSDASKVLTSKNWRDISSEVREDYRRLRNTNMVSGVIHIAHGGFLTHKSRVFFYLNEFHPVNSP